MEEILSSEQWVSGPHFLQLEEEHWPAQPIINDLPEEAKIKRAKEVYAASIKPSDEKCSGQTTGAILQLASIEKGYCYPVACQSFVTQESKCASF